MKRQQLEQEVRYWQGKYMAEHNAYVALVERVLAKEPDAVGIIKAMQGPMQVHEVVDPLPMYEQTTTEDIVTPPWEKEDPAFVLTPFDWEQNGHGQP